MDSAHIVYSRAVIEPVNFAKAIALIGAGQGWRPALWSARQTLLEIAKIELPRYEDRTRSRPNPRQNLADDVEPFFIDLFIDHSLVFVVNAPSIALATPGAMEARRYLERTLGLNDGRAVGVMVGEVGTEQLLIESLVQEFCAFFESALRRSIDGRKARHLKFQWEACDRR